MPPKTRITSDMIVEAAFEIARTEGAESINARTVSAKLGCSTQPVLYSFKTMEELKRAVYHKADAYHSAYLMNLHGDDPLKAIGLNYIRFGVEEKHLFRFLFQNNQFSGGNLFDLVNDEALQPVLEILSREAAIGMEQAKLIFRSLFLFAHGYAAMLANNEMTYCEKSVAQDLERMLNGTLCSLQGGQT